MDDMQSLFGVSRDGHDPLLQRLLTRIDVVDHSPLVVEAHPDIGWVGWDGWVAWAGWLGVPRRGSNPRVVSIRSWTKPRSYLSTRKLLFQGM